MIANILTLIQREFQLEWRQKTALGTIFSYVLGTSFLVYLVFQGNINIPTWIALFWIISLFTTVNATGKTFQKDANEQYYYIRQLVSPIEIIIAKIVYNTILISFLSLIIYCIFIVFFNQNVENPTLFLFNIMLASIGFSNLFTLFSAITARTQNMVLLSILGFPIILPMFLLVVKLSGLSDFFTQQNDVYFNIGAILILDIITFVLAVVLFPYLWKD